MLLRSPYVIDNLGADQPYNSMLVIAPFCFNSCNGCHNRGLKEAPLKDFTPEKLAEEFLKNPFWEGVTLGGLEPEHSQDHWWSEFSKFIELARPKSLTIYTSTTSSLRHFEVENLYYKTGIYLRDDEPKEINLDNWSIKLASRNQDFVKVY